MDDFKSFIPLDDLDALVFQGTFPTLHTQQPPISHQDLLISDPSLAPTPVPETGSALNQLPRGSLGGADDNNGGKRRKDDKKMKKIAHRDIERQRRHEMANLYTSLRNLLPVEYIKGKRSVSDHVSGAVNYIKYMEKNIKELQGRRNKLKNLSNEKDLSVPRENVKTLLPPEIKIRPCSNGVLEIIVRNATEDEAIPLSRVLQSLFEEGLSIISCVSSKINGKFLYTILTEESLMTGDDMCALLHQRLNQKLTL